MKVTIKILAMLLPAMAFAGERPDTVSTPLREVSVTSIKQAPSLATEPIAATTLEEKTISALNINDMNQVSEIVPNFFIPAYGSRMTSSIYVRGLGARIDQPAMGLNVDNIPVLNKNDYDFDLFDLERIEVIRGPQSTLYGRNTMGGVINVYTLSPMRYQGLRLLMEAASHGTWRTAMGIYHKFNPNFGLGLDLNAYTTEGEHVNLHTRSLFPQQNRKADQAEQYGARLKLAWTPRGNVSVDNVVAFTYNRQGGYPYAPVDTRQVNYNDTCYYNRTSVSEGLNVQWRAPGFTFSSITGLRYLDDDLMLDNDFTPASFFTLNQSVKEYSLTQDFIFRGSKGCYDWMGGIFGFVKHSSMEAPVDMLRDGIDQLILAQIPAFLAPRWESEHFVLHSDFVLPNWGLAAYHQSEVNLGRWTLTGALRLDYEHSAMFYHSDVSSGMFVRGVRFPVDIHRSDRLRQHWLELLPKLSVSYQLPMPSKSTVYASISKGYKAGGFNTQMFSDILQEEMQSELMAKMPGSQPNGVDYDVNEITSYKPEYSWNYELGAHISCAGGRIHTDLAAFYIDIRDQQLTVFPKGQTTGRMMTNAGRTRSAGAEVSVTVKPTERWLARASYGYTNARFLTYNDGDVSYKGKTIPYAPAHTAFAMVNYRQPLPMWWFDALSFQLDCRGVGPIYWDEANTQRQDFYALLGASVKLSLQKVSIDFWAENILNQDYDSFYFKSMGRSFVQRGAGRRLGVTLRYVM